MTWDRIWRWRRILPDRTGHRCRILARGKLNSCLIEFPDGLKVVTSRWAVRKAWSAEAEKGAKR